MPATGKVLLDTSVVVTLLRGDLEVCRRVAEAAEVFLPCIVAGELFYGARQSRNERLSLAAVEKFLDGATVLACDVDTAREYAAIKAALRAKGQPIPENDIWIAALARQHGLVLVTADQHFRHIDLVTIETWTAQEGAAGP